MKSTIVPFSGAANVSSALDGIIIAECLHQTIELFGAKNLALAIVEDQQLVYKQAA